MTTLSFKSGKTIMNKVNKIVKAQKQSVFAYQGKDEVVMWLKNFIHENRINRYKDIKAVLDAILESPFFGYEPVGQIAYNEPAVLMVLEKYQGNVR